MTFKRMNCFFFSIYILHKNLNRIKKKRRKMVPIESFVTGEIIDEDLSNRYHKKRKKKASFENQEQIKMI